MAMLMQSYEDEYHEISKRFHDELDVLQGTLQRGSAGYTAPPASGISSRQQRCASLSNLIAQMKDLVVNMNYECSDLPVALQKACKGRIDRFKEDIQNLEKTVAKMKVEASAADRQNLLGGSKERMNPTASSGLAGDDRNEMDIETQKYRAQMMDNTKKYEDASKTLLHAERLLNDTEMSGNETLTNLRTQTESMRQIQETVVNVDSEVSESRKILLKMQRAMIKHKLILFGIISILIFLILVAIYVEVSKTRRNRMPEPPMEPPSSTIPPSSITG
ncbi:unnamed protein product [Phytomonas sp. EM1]|nr:unnamed protein product [Phytomonas sp. EM1]|eukprot:CCW65058.1 unnamed protein product [Phytomonas sp. isolate EM1]